MPEPAWEKVKKIFEAALDRTPGVERVRFLNEACAGDTNLKEEVQSLLESLEGTDDFLEESPIGEVAETIVGKEESLSAGRQFGRYLIDRKLGAGGVGEVFLARDIELGRPAALKILSPEFSDHPDHIRRFLQEARAASALNHPNILTIYESGQVEDVRFIAAEYIKGETLRERLRRSPMNLDEILEIIAQTAAALNAAHRARIVHRDIKPENIMIRADGLVKVLDFGLAKLVEKESAESQDSSLTDFKTTPGLVMGTVAYMSPEQVRGLPTDERTDVWSVGVCLSEIVFGFQPFAGETVGDRIAAILKSEPEPQDSDAPPALRRIIEKCLEKGVENRYQTIEDLLLDINNLRQETNFSDGKGFFITRPPISATSQVSSAEYISDGIKSHKFYALAGVLTCLAALGLILYWATFRSPTSSGPIDSIAVLPFVNDGDDADVEYLSDGLSESLINKLSQLPQLKVATRSAAFQYKNKPADPREIARTLNVEAIVNGRVRRSGDDLQISVELINAAENTQIWGETYRRKMADAQAIQEEIAQVVLQKLQITPSGAQAQNFNSPVTTNAQAYQLYLNGVFYRRKNGGNSVEKAIEYQNQAIALDPNFALAYAELGYGQYTLVSVGAVDPQIGMPQARRSIEKALSLDETLAEAHDLNSHIKMFEYDWAGAEAEIHRALELNPNLSGAHNNYSDYLSINGRFEEALREIKRAQELDPLRTGLVGNEGIILFRARRYDEALVRFERGDPDAAVSPFPHIVLARAYLAKNRYQDAILALRRSLAIEERTTALVHLGRAYALAGQRTKSLMILERLKKSDKYVSPAELAILYSSLGRRELAFENLERAFAEHDPMLPYANVEPEYDALRDDPHFSDLMRRINLKN